MAEENTANHLSDLFDVDPEPVVDPNVDPIIDPVDPELPEPKVPAEPAVKDDTADGLLVDPDPTVGPTVEELQQDISSLRTMLQEQAQLIKGMATQSDGLVKNLSDAGHIDANLLSVEEVAEGTISPERMENLSLLAANMEVSPSYPNFIEICSEANFNKVTDGLARLAVQEDGGTLTDQLQNVTAEIWSMPNPYKFVYDLLSQHDPKYKAAEAPTPGKETLKAPTSLNSIPGSDDKSAGWTTAKIDAMDEEDLTKIPKDVYDLYMSNQLK